MEATCHILERRRKIDGQVPISMDEIQVGDVEKANETSLRCLRDFGSARSKCQGVLHTPRIFIVERLPTPCSADAAIPNVIEKTGSGCSGIFTRPA
ncbi:unnamed protein product [Aphanomyces euteiches]